MRIPDELLERLGNKFVREGIYDRTLIPFERFLNLYVSGLWKDPAK